MSTGFVNEFDAIGSFFFLKLHTDKVLFKDMNCSRNDLLNLECNVMGCALRNLCNFCVLCDCTCLSRLKRCGRTIFTVYLFICYLLHLSIFALDFRTGQRNQQGVIDEIFGRDGSAIV